MYLLDTNVISELRARRAGRSVPVRSWANSVSANELYLAAATLMELEIGVLSIERRDAPQGFMLRNWLQEVQAEFSTRILPFGAHTALICAALQVPNRRPERDAMIAATAREHGYTLVTRNTSDFEGCRVQLLNPWDTP